MNVQVLYTAAQYWVLNKPVPLEIKQNRNQRDIESNVVFQFQDNMQVSDKNTDVMAVFCEFGKGLKMLKP